jgi:hypothetical protein
VVPVKNNVTFGGNGRPVKIMLLSAAIIWQPKSFGGNYFQRQMGIIFTGHVHTHWQAGNFQANYRQQLSSQMLPCRYPILVVKSNFN